MDELCRRSCRAPRRSEIDEDTLIDLCDDAVRAEVLTDDGDVGGRRTFTHARIEHALHDNLSAGRRGRAHRTVAEALESDLWRRSPVAAERGYGYIERDVRSVLEAIT